MKITLELDAPVVVHLIDLAGRECESGYPPEGRVWSRTAPPDTYWVFEAEEGVFYLPDTQGALFRARLRARGIAAGEPVVVVKTKVANPNSARPVVEVIPYPWVEATA